jgi:hypothetical protein
MPDVLSEPLVMPCLAVPLGRLGVPVPQLVKNARSQAFIDDIVGVFPDGMSYFTVADNADG